jgi:hypothetical protein
MREARVVLCSLGGKKKEKTKKKRERERRKKKGLRTR